MKQTCLSCRHFDPYGELPVCILHKKFMHEDWSCADYKYVHESLGDEDATAQEAEG